MVGLNDIVFIADMVVAGEYTIGCTSIGISVKFLHPHRLLVVVPYVPFALNEENSIKSADLKKKKN